MEQVQVKVTVTSSPRKRAKTWEISDSEGEEPDGVLKGGMTGAEAGMKCMQVSDDEYDSPFVKAEPQELLRCQQVDLGADGGELGWTGAERAEPSGLQKDQRDVHHSPTTSALSLPLPKSTTPSPGKKTRRKKSPEELEADRAQAEEKKREKEQKRQEKEKIKNLEKAEREKRKESAQALKLLRPDQCGKYMVVQVDAGRKMSYTYFFLRF